ncbi:MAG TPA: response regulator [Thermomicrobiales bacterium]|nr:response regulator [Thermomicrobiales bacterium]
MNILVVDDDLADLLRDFFEDEGHAVVTTTDGDQALRRLAESTFDLVITDVFHPGPKGPEIAREALNRGLRTIMVSAAPIVDCPDGAVCLPKPIAFRDVLALLD